MTTPLVIYAAWMADVMMRSMFDTQWLPNLILLAAFNVLRTPLGVVWCEIAGLVCDGIADRPLGVTMLAATLTATVMGELARRDTDMPAWRLVKTFVFVAIVECAARVVTETIKASPNATDSLVRGIETAFATTVIATVLIGGQRLMKRSPQLRSHSTLELESIHRIR